MNPFLDCYGMTDKGLVRKSNEDQFLIADLHKSMLVAQTSLSEKDYKRLLGKNQGKLIVVADGMGGTKGGSEASKLAVETLAEYLLNYMPWFFSLDRKYPEDLHESLVHSLELCQLNVEAAGAAHGAPKMGTTLTAAYILWPNLYILHAGDSRCYLLRKENIEQLTEDHTVAAQISKEKGVNVDKKFGEVLTNAIGGGQEGELKPEVKRCQLQSEDILFLCSDGLTKHVKESEITSVLNKKESASQGCQELIDLAKERGGSDNITVAIARFREEENSKKKKAKQAKEFMQTSS